MGSKFIKAAAIFLFLSVYFSFSSRAQENEYFIKLGGGLNYSYIYNKSDVRAGNELNFIRRNGYEYSLGLSFCRKIRKTKIGVSFDLARFVSQQSFDGNYQILYAPPNEFRDFSFSADVKFNYLRFPLTISFSRNLTRGVSSFIGIGGFVDYSLSYSERIDYYSEGTERKGFLQYKDKNIIDSYFVGSQNLAYYSEGSMSSRIYRNWNWGYLCQLGFKAKIEDRLFVALCFVYYSTINDIENKNSIHVIETNPNNGYEYDMSPWENLNSRYYKRGPVGEKKYRNPTLLLNFATTLSILFKIN